MLSNASSKKKRKNYPGHERVVGSKDYALILTNLRGFIHQLQLPKSDDELATILQKVSVKLKELGYKQVSETIKKKSLKAAKIRKELEPIVEQLNQVWKEGKQKHEEAKKQKQLPPDENDNQDNPVIEGSL